MNRHAFLALTLTLMSCGTLDAPGHGDTDLPNNRTGPFRALGNSELDGGTCVLGSFVESFEDPDVVTGNNGEISLYATRVRGDARAIVRVGLDPSLRVRAAPEVVLEDPAGASAPSVVRTADGWVMAFARNGRVDVAYGTDGRAWTVRPLPLLTQDRVAREDSPLAAPSLARDPDGRWSMVYTSGDAVWLARGDAADGLYTRIDGDPGTPTREPILGGAEGVTDGGVVVQRRYADPVITAERTSTGRAIWRVYARETSRRVVDGGAVEETAIAMAASYDGVRFTRASSLALSGRADPAPAGPTVLFDGAVRTWMFFSGACGASTRGVRAAVAPGSAALPIGR